MVKRSKIKHIQIENIVFTVQMCLVALSLAVYIYFIMTSVFQIVLRQELQISIQTAETKISELESIYFEKTDSISRATAEDFGLVAISPTAYVELAPDGDRITRKDN